MSVWMSVCRQTLFLNRNSSYSFCLILTKLGHVIYVPMRKRLWNQIFVLNFFGDFLYFTFGLSLCIKPTVCPKK